MARGTRTGVAVVEAVDAQLQGVAADREGEKLCKVCQMAGKAVHVHTFHNTVDCKPLYTSFRSIYIDDEDEDFKDEEDDQFGAEEPSKIKEESHDS